MELSRALFESAIDNLLERVRNSVTQLLTDANVQVDQVDTVFFTGGSSGIPALRNSVSAMLPNARHVEGNIFGSIGSGLAIEAAKRYGVDGLIQNLWRGSHRRASQLTQQKRTAAATL